MLVFLSWSGTRSRNVAVALETWLVQVIQALEPWISTDIDKGARWSPEIAEKLEHSRVGIICLTRENLSSAWILFEAGALSKTKNAHVCTFLLDIKPADVALPLGQFQHTQLEKDDIKKLLHTVNDAIRLDGEKALSEQVLNGVFETYWPKLHESLEAIAAEKAEGKPKERTDREVMQEILESIRGQDRRLSRIEQSLPVTLSSSQALSETDGLNPDESPRIEPPPPLRMARAAIGTRSGTRSPEFDRIFKEYLDRKSTPKVATKPTADEDNAPPKK